MTKNNKKFAFTLVESFIFITILSIMLAAAAPMISKKARSAPNIIPHGTYMCYRDIDGNLIQDIYNARTRVSRSKVNQCTFTPRSRTVLHKIDIIGPGSAGCVVYESKSSNAVKNSEVEVTKDRGFTAAQADGYSTRDEDNWPAYYNLSDARLKGAFSGAELRRCVGTTDPSSGDASDLEFIITDYESHIICGGSSDENILKEYCPNRDGNICGTSGNALKTDNGTDFYFGEKEVSSCPGYTIYDIIHGFNVAQECTCEFRGFEHGLVPIFTCTERTYFDDADQYLGYRPNCTGNASSILNNVCSETDGARVAISAGKNLDGETDVTAFQRRIFKNACLISGGTPRYSGYKDINGNKNTYSIIAGTNGVVAPRPCYSITLGATGEDTYVASKGSNSYEKYLNALAGRFTKQAKTTSGGGWQNICGTSFNTSETIELKNQSAGYSPDGVKFSTIPYVKDNWSGGISKSCDPQPGMGGMRNRCAYFAPNDGYYKYNDSTNNYTKESGHSYTAACINGAYQKYNGVDNKSKSDQTPDIKQFVTYTTRKVDFGSDGARGDKISFTKMDLKGECEITIPPLHQPHKYSDSEADRGKNLATTISCKYIDKNGVETDNFTQSVGLNPSENVCRKIANTEDVAKRTTLKQVYNSDNNFTFEDTVTHPKDDNGNLILTIGYDLTNLWFTKEGVEQSVIDTFGKAGKGEKLVDKCKPPTIMSWTNYNKNTLGSDTYGRVECKDDIYDIDFTEAEQGGTGAVIITW